MRKRCDHCGELIDAKNDIDCCEMKMFELKYLFGGDSTYTQADKGNLYYCGACKDELLVRWVKNYTNKSYKQIKSKERVNKYAEVYTNEREVKAMCELIPPHIWKQVDSTFLEPCCGNGNFLVEILERKLNMCGNSVELGLKALNSIYGIDILSDNVEECKMRLFNVFVAHFPKSSAITGIQAAMIIERNIVCGNSLEIMEEMTEETNGNQRNKDDS